jgi:hypothetical protein
LAARKGVKVTREQLSSWYYDERKTTSEIGELLGIDQANVIYWMKKLNVPRRSKSDALTKTKRNNFSEDKIIKAYLIGFRLGDLHVYKIHPKQGKTTRIVCASSKMAQIRLIQSLFESYGYVKTTRKADGITMISCYVNDSFDFLLSKQDLIEEWIMAEMEYSLAFLAGYIDAEGSFKIDMNDCGNLKIESYDKKILHQLYDILSRANVICPPPKLIKKKETSRQRLNQDLWRLGVYKKESLNRLCSLLEPRLRHEQRKLDMLKVWQNVQKRNTR